MLSLETVNRPLWLDLTATAPSRSAADFCKYHELQLGRDARSLLKTGLSTEEYLDLLLVERSYADARRILAHALPKRRALWWGCLCAWDVYRPQPPEDVARVLMSVVAFVREPTEENRRIAAARAREVEANTLPACLAMAAFCSGGSLAPAGLPCVAPRPFLTGRLVGVAVYLASVMRDPARYKDRLRHYLSLGIEISRGNNLWTPYGVNESVEQTVGDAGGFLPSIDNSTSPGIESEQATHAICGSA
jgi:hypothetical protein